MDADNGNRGVVVVSASFSGGIAAQHDPLKTLAVRRDIITSQPARFYHVAVGRRGVLLVLRGKDPAAGLALQLLDGLDAVALRLQQFPGRPLVDLILADPIRQGFDGDRGHYQLGPALLDQDAGKIVDVEPLHRDTDQTLGGIIEPAMRGVAEPADRATPSNFRIGVISLDRIIDDQDPAAAAGQCAADGGG